MMGRLTRRREALVYSFRLDERVPQDHLLRRIDAVLDLGDLHARLEPFYSGLGRPSVDPELMLRMLIVGYCYGIRSERRLCDEVGLNLAYRWFCRLGLDDPVPDHSTFSKNRHGRFRTSDLFRHVFERVVKSCMAARLIEAEGFAVAASLVEADASRFARVASHEVDWADPAHQTRAVREYLAALDPELGEMTTVSPTDPAAAWTTKGRQRVAFAYGLNYLIDTAHAVIVDVEATPGETSREAACAPLMLARTEARLGLKPRWLAGDTAYGTSRFLGWLSAHAIAPHIPVWDKGERGDGTLPRSAFAYDRHADCYRCPEGKPLTTTGRVHDGHMRYYRASKLDCERCPRKRQCTPHAPERRLARDVNEAARDEARALAGTDAFARAAKRRKRVERLFAQAKHQMGLTRLRLRGLAGARDEFLLAAIVQNLRRLAAPVTAGAA